MVEYSFEKFGIRFRDTEPYDYFWEVGRVNIGFGRRLRGKIDIV